MTFLGNTRCFGFEVPHPIGHPDLTTVAVWIGGIRLATSGCYLPSFLQMAQRFYQRQITFAELPDVAARLDALCPRACLLLLREIIRTAQNAGQTPPPYSMNGFDEATDNYRIFVVDTLRQERRVLYEGRAECGTCPEEHVGTVGEGRLSDEELFRTFRELFAYFKCNVAYSNSDWAAWHERYARGFQEEV